MFLFKKNKQNKDDEIVIGKAKKNPRIKKTKRTDERLDKLRNNPDEIIVYSEDTIDQLVELNETSRETKETIIQDNEVDTNTSQSPEEVLNEEINEETNEDENIDNELINLEQVIKPKLEIQEEPKIVEEEINTLITEEPSKEEVFEELIKDEMINDISPVIKEEDQEELIDDEEVKDLNTYFGNNNDELKKGKKKKTKKEKVSKRKKRRKKDLEDITERRVYKFRDKKFSKVEDLIEYLNDHYLDIEELSKEMLDSEEFYGFISKKSGIFDSSLKEYKKIKKEIEK